MTTCEQAFEGASTRFVVIVMLVLSALIAIDRIYVPEVPINVDPASYAVVSHELLDGKSLYTDIWDHKPPAPFVTYALAEIAFGYSPQTLRILNFIVCLIGLWGIFLAAKYGPGGQIAGLVAAFLWSIVSGSVGLEGRDANTEPFINAYVVFAFYLIVANRQDGLSFLNSFIVGLLFLCASFYKPIVAANVVLITLAYLGVAKNSKRAIYSSLTIGAVGVSGWMVLFAYFYATGRGDIFYKSVVVFNDHYSGYIIENIVAPFVGSAKLFVDVVGPLILSATIGVVCSYLYEKHLGVLIAAYSISAWIALAATGRFWVHYYQLWVPSLVIASAWGIGYFLVSAKTAHRAIAYAVGFTLAATLVAFQLPYYRTLYAKEFIPILQVLNAANRSVDAINVLLRDEETFYLWGTTPNLYLLANRRPPASVLFDSHLRDSPIAGDLAAQVRDQLERSRPEILVIEQDVPPAPEWLTKEFESTPVYSDPHSYKMYVRRGGRIANDKKVNADERQ